MTDNLWVIFLTGLTVGGFSCAAVQGGLLASAIASREEEDIQEGGPKKHTIFPTLSFLITKLIVYIILGLVLGAFGGALSLSDTTRTYMQLVAGIYMIAVALNLLNVHPIFRYAVLQPPKFLMRMIRNKSKSKDLFAPAFLGALTIFIPCGTTLAMEALAISSGNALTGAGIMGAFILGTTPLFFGIGLITTALGDAFREKFFKIAAFAVIYLGLTSINGSLTALGAPITFQSIGDAIPIEINLGDGTDNSSAQGLAQVIDGVQVAEIKALAGGYSPNYIRVKKDIPLRLNLVQQGGYSCAAAFSIPELGINKRIPRGGSEVVEFTPTKLGKITWTCSMGMYSGVLEVI